MRALVIGASGGIGAAVSTRLGQSGWVVTALSRANGDFDMRDPASISATLDGLTGPYDLIFIATGILAAAEATPEKSLAAIAPDQMAEVFAVNAIGPAMILRAAPQLLPRDRRAVVAVLSARVGSIADNKIGGWHSYRASKAALNQIIRGAAIELGRSHKQAVCVALHPGTVATPFTARYAGRHKTQPADQAAQAMLDVLAELGPAQTGQFYDYAGEVIAW